jgi:hypothetical protein
MCRCDFSDRLYTPSVEHMWITSLYEPGQGWTTTVQHRHSGEATKECCVDVYTSVTSDELVEVLDAALWSLMRDLEDPTSLADAGVPTAGLHVERRVGVNGYH